MSAKTEVRICFLQRVGLISVLNVGLISVLNYHEFQIEQGVAASLRLSTLQQGIKINKLSVIQKLTSIKN